MVWPKNSFSSFILKTIFCINHKSTFISTFSSVVKTKPFSILATGGSELKDEKHKDSDSTLIRYFVEMELRNASSVRFAASEFVDLLLKTGVHKQLINVVISSFTIRFPGVSGRQWYWMGKRSSPPGTSNAFCLKFLIKWYCERGIHDVRETGATFWNNVGTEYVWHSPSSKRMREKERHVANAADN